MKTNIVLTIAVVALCYFLFKKEKPHNIIKEKIEIVEVCEVIDNTKPARIEKVYIKVPAKTKYKEIKKTVHDTVYIHKKVNKFVFKDTLKNGYLTSFIVADTIYQRDVALTLFEKTKTIEKMTFRARIYLGGSLHSKELKELHTASLNAYLARQKSLIGIGYGYDLIDNHSLINLTLAFKL